MRRRGGNVTPAASGNDAARERRRTMTRHCEVCGQTTGRESGDVLCRQCAKERDGAGLRDELERIKAHIDNQYRAIEDAILKVEDPDDDEPVPEIESLLENIADDAERTKAIADETREAFYHVA